MDAYDSVTYASTVSKLGSTAVKVQKSKDEMSTRYARRLLTPACNSIGSMADSEVVGTVRQGLEGGWTLGCGKAVSEENRCAGRFLIQ